MLLFIALMFTDDIFVAYTVNGQVSSPDEVSLWEALLTVLQFPLLILHAYAEDRNCPYISISFWTRKVLNWAQETGGNDLKQNQNFSPDDSYDDSG